MLSIMLLPQSVYFMFGGQKEKKMLSAVLVAALALGGANGKVISCSVPTVPIRSQAEYLAGVRGNFPPHLPSPSIRPDPHPIRPNQCSGHASPHSLRWFASTGSCSPMPGTTRLRPGHPTMTKAHCHSVTARDTSRSIRLQERFEHGTSGKAFDHRRVIIRRDSTSLNTLRRKCSLSHTASTPRWRLCFRGRRPRPRQWQY